MKRLAIVLLCLMFCLTGFALAQNEGCTHENAVYSSMMYNNNTWQHMIDCLDCGLKNHAAEPEYVSNGVEGHTVLCPECGASWTENHIRACDDTNETGVCVFCNAENVSREGIYHPVTVTELLDEYSHHSYCGICGDDWGAQQHTADCLYPDRCKDCNAEDVCISWVDHDVQMTGFDKVFCYFSCPCGEQARSNEHAVYCDSEDQNTCIYCGKNTEADDIVIRGTEHHNETFHDENECWQACTNCGELIRNEHYFLCIDQEKVRCAFCGASDEEVNILNTQHVCIDFNDMYDDWHAPRCIECGESFGEPHEKSIIYEYGGRDQCRVVCEICGFLANWQHQGQCGEPNDHTACLRCGADDVRVADHTNHPDEAIVSEYMDEDVHHRYCGICGDDWGTEYHRALCGKDDTCYKCGAENVNIESHDDHPEDNETAVYIDENVHRVRCGVCGDDWGEREHEAECGNPDQCIACGAEGLYIFDIEHQPHFIYYDSEFCYYSCDCGEISYEMLHAVYCDSEDKNTCIECGMNTENDGIEIRDCRHYTEVGHNEDYCWTACSVCGDMLYYGGHYNGCSDYFDDEERCDNCGLTAMDGVNVVWKHTALTHDEWDDEGVAMHRQICWDCGYVGGEHVITDDTDCHPIDGDMYGHAVSCYACEFEWKEDHAAECGKGDEACVICGAENVRVSNHINHPEGTEIYVYSDQFTHNRYCGICGDRLGWDDHAVDCSDMSCCKYCNSDDMYPSRIEHESQLIGFDRESCYYRCACGDESWSMQHAVYCDSEDRSTCIGCGKNIETDLIKISAVRHHEQLGYDKDECWNTCTNCGDLYRGEHYYDCIRNDPTMCAYCGASFEEVNIRIFRHADIDINEIEDGLHDPWCMYCGEHLGEPHELSMYFVSGGYEWCRVYCEICGYLNNWSHLGQCGEGNEHTECIRCGAEDVIVCGHGNHSGENVKESIDWSYHAVYCSVCGDELYTEEHKCAIGFDEVYGTCVVCGAENVRLSGPVTHEERVEDGILMIIDYNDDGSKFITYNDAETGVYYGFERYEGWFDEEPTDWERRSSHVFDKENDLLTCDVESSWGESVNTYRWSSGRLIHEEGFNHVCYYENVLDEEEGIWNCTEWEDVEKNRIVNIRVCTEYWEDTISEQYFAYDVMDIPGSRFVQTWEYGIEVSKEFYTAAEDEEPSQWERYFNTEFETEELE